MAQDLLNIFHWHSSLESVAGKAVSEQVGVDVDALWIRIGNISVQCHFRNDPVYMG